MYLAQGAPHGKPIWVKWMGFGHAVAMRPTFRIYVPLPPLRFGKGDMIQVDNTIRVAGIFQHFIVVGIFMRTVSDIMGILRWINVYVCGGWV